MVNNWTTWGHGISVYTTKNGLLILFDLIFAFDQQIDDAT